MKNRKLESEGNVENLNGKVQDKIGEIEKVAGKWSFDKTKQLMKGSPLPNNKTKTQL